MPSCAAAWRALMHGFELGGDVLQGALGSGGLDAGDQANEAVVAMLGLGARQQTGLDQSLGGEAAHGATQPLDGPGAAVGLARSGGGGAVENPDDVAPGVIGTQAAHEGEPGLHPRQHCVEIAGITAGAELADGVGVAGAETGIAAEAATRPGGAQSGLGALGDQRPLELGDGAQNLERKHALRGGGVDGIAQTAKMRPRGFELLDDREEMADRARQAVEPHDDEGVALADVAEQAGEHRAGAIGAGGVFLEDFVASGGVQFVALGVRTLIIGGRPGHSR